MTVPGSAHSENDIGVPYIITTKAPGFSIESRFVWQPYPEGMKLPRNPLPCLPTVAKEKIMRQLGQLTCRLLEHPFSKLGSLFKRDGEYVVEECLSPTFTWNSRDSLSEAARGPFDNEKAYY